MDLIFRSRTASCRALRFVPAALLPAALLLAGTGACRAQAAFSVSLDTRSLIGNASGPFSLDFQFTDGSGTNDANNTVTLSHFAFGSGAPAGTATISGGAAGSLTSRFTLTDISFLNEAFQTFTPGSTLTFDVSMTGNGDAGPTPDEFSFAILDGALSDIPTTGATGALLIADITPQGITPQTFAGDGAYASLPAPQLGSPVPELGTRPAFAAGLAALLLLLRRRARRA